jgi:hypothetical protein
VKQTTQITVWENGRIASDVSHKMDRDPSAPRYGNETACTDMPPILSKAIGLGSCLRSLSHHQPQSSKFSEENLEP